MEENDSGCMSVLKEIIDDEIDRIYINKPHQNGSKAVASTCSDDTFLSNNYTSPNFKQAKLEEMATSTHCCNLGTHHWLCYACYCCI